MQKLLTLSLILLTFLQIPAAQSLVLEKTSMLSEVLGFFNAQSKSLERIKNEYPDLKSDATLAELKWNAQFGKVKIEAERQLRDLLKDRYDAVVARGYQKFNESFSALHITREDATSFIALVNERIKGNIEEKVRSKILMLHPDLIKYPEQEIIRGFKNEFKSLGTEPKSKGIKIRFLYPGSWKQKETVLPNAFFKASNQAGEGSITMNIVVKDFTQNKEQLTKAVLEYMVSMEGNKEFAELVFAESELIDALKSSGMKNQSFSDYKRITITGNPAVKITTSGMLEKEGLDLVSYFTQYSLISKNYLVYITFSSSGISNEETKAEFEKFKPTFGLIINSFVVLNRYE